MKKTIDKKYSIRLKQYKIMAVFAGVLSIGTFLFAQIKLNSMGNIRGSILSSSSNSQTVFGRILSEIKPSKTDFSADFEELKNALSNKQGEYAVYIHDFNSNGIFAYNEDKEFFGASLYKTGLAAGVLEQVQTKKVSWTKELIYTQGDYFDGSGVLNKNQFGTKLSLEQVFEALLVHSDNVAQMMLKRYFNESVFRNAFTKNLPDDSNARFYIDNYTTAEHSTVLLENLYLGNFLTQESKTKLFTTLSDTSFDDRLIPHLDKDLRFAHKIGNWGEEGSWHNCGIVYKKDGLLQKDDSLAVCLLSKGTTYEAYLDASKLTAEFINSIL